MPWSWYGVKTLYRVEARGRAARKDSDFDPDATLVEERVVLVRARSFDDAIARAEKEARAYAASPRWASPYGQQVATRYLGECDAFLLAADPGAGAEVYSRTAIVSASLSDNAMAESLLGREETAHDRRRRRKFDVG